MNAFRRAIAVVCMLPGLALATDAGASIGYPDSDYLSEAGRNSAAPRVAVAPGGSAISVWVTYAGSNGRIKARWIEPDGSKGPIKTLSPSGQDAISPAVVVDGSGRATVVWSSDLGVDEELQSRRVLADGTLEPRQTLDPDIEFAQPVPLVDFSDRVTVLWQDYNRIRSVRLAADGTPGAVLNLTPAGHKAGTISGSIDPAGRVFASWIRTDASSYKLAARRIEVDRSLGPLKEIKSDISPFALPRIVAVSGDQAVLVWSCCGASKQQLQSRALEGDGTLGSVNDLTPKQGTNWVPPFSLAYDNTDHGTLAWKDFTHNSTSLKAERLDSSGAPSSEARNLGETNSTSTSPAVVIDSLGRSTVASANYAEDELFAVRMNADGTRGPARSISDPAATRVGDPFAAISPDNRPALVWKATEDANDRIAFNRATLTAPETTITSGPPDGSATNEQTPTFEFTSNADAATFDCSTDGGPFVSCTSPTTLPTLSEGAHSFAVRATDDDGTDASPAISNFTYDPDADPLDTKVEGRKVKASEKQKQKGRLIKIKVKAGADEDVTATLTGSVDPKGKSRPFDLQKIKGKAVDAGDLRAFTLSPRKSSDQKKLVKSLDKDGAAKAKIKVKLTDVAGNETSKSVAVKLK